MPVTAITLSPPQRRTQPPQTVGCEHHSAAGVLLGCLAAVLYAASFLLPATGQMLGYQAFVSAAASVVFLPVWFANPVFWLGLAVLAKGQYSSAGKAGLLALAFALPVAWPLYPRLGVGYFAWGGSMGFGELGPHPAQHQHTIWFGEHCLQPCYFSKAALTSEKFTRSPSFGSRKLPLGPRKHPL
jgi:hypothetical protein